MRRSGPPQRRRRLAAGKPLARGKGIERTAWNPDRKPLRAKAKPAARAESEAVVRRVVFARDGGCVMRRFEPRRCFGRRTFHHLDKAGQGGTYTAGNGVCLCVGHNDDVEDDPPLYRMLGLVVRPGLDHHEAFARRVAAGLTPNNGAMPMPANTGTCRGCDADMRWAVTAERGKGVPLDPEPVDDGPLVFTGEQAGDGRMIVAYYREGVEAYRGMPRYRSHFETCPEAASFRKPRS